jgi:hypothetical protein
MSLLVDLLSIILFSIALMLPGFLLAYALRFRSRAWGPVLVFLGAVLAVGGWAAAFSVAGLVLIVLGLPLFGAGVEGTALARKGT